jgi:hypothetical protein
MAKRKMAKNLLDKNKGKLLFENLKKQVSIIFCCPQLYSNSNINIDNDDTISMNKGTGSMTKQIWLSAVKCLINKTHGNLQHPIVFETFEDTKGAKE